MNSKYFKHVQHDLCHITQTVKQDFLVVIDETIID